MRFFSGIAAVVASGVGGGSLIYANIHIRPDPVVFDDPRWPRPINRPTLDPYYDRVARMLAVGPVPAQTKLPKRDIFHRAASRIGCQVFDPDEAVKWQGISEPGRETCRMCTECEFGCQFGAKNTLDFNYLTQAMMQRQKKRAICRGGIAFAVGLFFVRGRKHLPNLLGLVLLLLGIGGILWDSPCPQIGVTIIVHAAQISSHASSKLRQYV